MALAQARVVFQGETPYAHEREAIDFAVKALPNTDPYHVWALVDLLDAGSGHLYEIDLLVLGYGALYLVEIKSGPGRYEGDGQDWYRTVPGEKPHYLECPYRLTNHKAKVLASRLRAKMKTPRTCPWVVPLVFLSHEAVELGLRADGSVHVVTRKDFAKAIQHHDFYGADPRHSRRIERPVMKDVVQALGALGIKARKGKLQVGSYELTDLLGEGAGYQDRLAVHRERRAMTRRARTYLVPQQTSVERRQQLRNAADREAELLEQLRDHPGILRLVDYTTDAPLGPTVLFDSFDGVTLDTFLRRHPNLPFSDRVEILRQTARALAYCHKKKVIHGALCPQAVLVRKNEEGLKVRLFNFQLGMGENVEATSHYTAFAAEPWLVYQAPELRHDPSARSPASDTFSLGALAYFLFTGRPPAETLLDVEKILAAERCLDPRRADDSIEKNVAEAVAFATDIVVPERADDVTEWLELLLDKLTQPEEAERPTISPLEVRKEELLGDDLLVEAVLGHGATSRVLRVHRSTDDRSYALKVALNPDHDERLEDEAKTLQKLHHERIVQLVDRYTFSDRPCLLLSLAGGDTLERHLAQEGTVSLEYASRYGEDLLSALQHLEEKGVLHRDIKPANLAVGAAGKEANHLTLFDFSLVSAPLSDLGLGTAAYRDPFLRQRGSFDHAAERWSAAVTLHEMLTGVRPAFKTSHLADEEIELSAERFDPSVRDSLAAFFQRALAKDADRRFSTTEEMRRAWVAAFEAPQVVLQTDTAEPSGDLPIDFGAIEPDTPIEALPLEPRAKNALDRAGLSRASDLFALPDNRLSAIRGIGREVARSILDFRNAWQAARAVTPPDEKPFFFGYRGEDLMLEASPLPKALLLSLKDAGLRTLGAVAGAPARQIESLAERQDLDTQPLSDLLKAENARADERAHPSTLEGWIDALLPKKPKRMAHLRSLYGIEGPFAGRLDVTVPVLAEALKQTPANLYIALGKARTTWTEHPALFELKGLARPIVEESGGALPLAQAAETLLSLLPHDEAAKEKAARAGALFRILAEVEKEDPAGFRLKRLDQVPWIFDGEARAKAVRNLGDAADRLAERAVLASPGEAARIFRSAVEDTPLAGLSSERLAALAAAASKRAACSTRLEIYPKAMPPERALGLSAAVLKSGVTPDQVKRSVALRYPEASHLPDRPELDRILAAEGLQFDPVRGAYFRKGERAETTYGTRVSTFERSTATPTGARPQMDEATVERRQFETRLRDAVERRQFRVLGVSVDRAEQAALALAKAIGTEPTPLDTRLLEAVQTRMTTLGIKREEVIHQADREGPTGKAWRKLVELVEGAAEDLAARLLPPKAPLLLVQPGLLARYHLTDFLEALRTKDRQAPAVFLLVPAFEAHRKGTPKINGELPIPGLLPGQYHWIPKSWLTKNHPQAA